LTIDGSKFGDALRVLVNGKDLTKSVTGSSDSTIGLKAKKKKLGIVAGDNTVQVIDATGLTSNVFTFAF
jgi:hypothetical protein